MVTINNARKILQRVDTLPLYLHAYAFHLNMRLERMLPADLLDIASENNLRGVKIHVLDGERFSLGNMDDKELSAFGDKARRLNLDIHIETSASDKASIDEAVAIALKTGASSVRFYPRYSHPVYLFLRKFSLQDSRGGSSSITLRCRSSLLHTLS